MNQQTPVNDPSLYNEDLAPIPASKRTWGTWNYAALWISMSLCIPSYQLASGMIDKGMNWWQAILTMFLGNLIVLVPMLLNGHAGAKYGIPFPVLVRSSFGTKGANIPAILRAIVACGWFGIQTWIGGKSLYRLLKVWDPSLPELTINGLFPDLLPLVCFLCFWALNMYVIYRGVDSIRKLLVFKAIFLPIAAVALLCWAFWIMQNHGGIGQVFSVPSKFENSSSFFNYFIPALTGVVGFWATLSLNIPDFTRYAKSQQAQRRGQALGLPASMTFIAFVAVVVSLTTTFVFNETIWEPEALVGRIGNKIVVSFALLAVVIATLATNIAANIVSPANDFSNLAPKKINFRTGGYITGIIGILIFPWKLVEDPTGYIFSWLIGYSALLGPIGGIMIADYFFTRKKQLAVSELYNPTGIYSYGNGFNNKAIIAFLVGVVPNIPGFLLQVKLVSANAFPAWISELYHYAWFVGFFVSGFVYWIMMRTKR
ncbi:MAG TPA: NCS1 family nucleobase:cation symporter-1 [Chitinophagaceae bacterium]|jgi:NCS1 family nucleobase:cation symporter-1|nr:NCS1 family nucleobase:cation symporter-1 [Chitinophagaceae bacterium]